MKVVNAADYKSPRHKVIGFLKEARDRLRDKYRKLRSDLRKAENQVRAVTKSRDAWKERAKAAEAAVRNFQKKSRPR